jgi:hypothetical protein
VKCKVKRGLIVEDDVDELPGWRRPDRIEEADELLMAPQTFIAPFVMR